MFRDESETVIAKACGRLPRQRGKAKNLPGSSSASSTTATPQAIESDPAEKSIITRSPKLDQDNGLVDFFANNFTCGGLPTARHNLFWIPSNFEEILRDSNVTSAIQCTGAMALARLHKSTEYVTLAHGIYSSALRGLADMGKINAKIERDVFSFAALFLSFFEVLASYDSSSRQSWRTHLSGIGGMFERLVLTSNPLLYELC
jgi:hypothetical protein